MSEPLFLSTAVLLIHTRPLPHAQRLAEVNDIDFIFCLQAQWQTFGEKEEHGRQAQEANCVHGIPQLSHVWLWGLVGFFKSVAKSGSGFVFPLLLLLLSQACRKSLA